MTMGAQEETLRGPREVAAGMDNEQLREPAGWQIVVQTISRLEQSLRSDMLSRETKTEIGSIRQDLRETDKKIEALRLEIKSDIEKLRESLESKLDKIWARFDKLTFLAIGIIVTIILAAGYIGHR